jgi:hypothetical protein
VTFIPATEAMARGVCSWCGKKLRFMPRPEGNAHITVPSCGCMERAYQKRVRRTDV